MTRPTPAQIIDCAIDVLHDGGWQQRQPGFTDVRNSPHCMTGALLTAAREFGMVSSHDLDEISKACRKVLGLASMGIDQWALENWNDESERTADDVIHALKLAAEELR